MKKLTIALFSAILVLASQAWAFDANQSFTIVLGKVNSNGTTTDIETKTVLSDSNGKISFSFAAVPNTTDGVNFLVVTVKNGGGTVVRQGLIPAPSSSSTTLSGVNSLSDVQARALLNGAANCATDDPIYGAFGFVMLLSSKLSETDRNHISAGGCTVIRGTGGFEDYLQNTLGVTAPQMTTFRNNIILNSTAAKNDLADFCSNFKDAVDNDSEDSLAKAGGMLADIFIDAANAAGFDPQLLTTALEAIGGKAETNTDFLATSASAKLTMDQAIDSFFRRVKSLRTNTEYNDAMTALGATGAQVTRYTTAADTMLTCFQNIDKTHRAKFEDQAIDSTLKTTIQNAYDTCYTTFQTAIQSTDAEITALKSTMATALGIQVAQLPGGFGTQTVKSGSTVNISIPEALQYSFVATLITNGGSLAYSSRDTTSIPSNMLAFLTSRTDFDTSFGALHQSFKNLFKINEDVQIIQFSFFNIFSGGQPTFDAIRDAKKTVQDNLAAAIARITGTTNGSTAITAVQAKALVKMAMEPDQT